MSARSNSIVFIFLVLLPHWSYNTLIGSTNVTTDNCEFNGVTATGERPDKKKPFRQNFPSWLNNGKNPIAMVMFGSVSPRTSQAKREVELIGNPLHQYCALGPVARLYEKNLYSTNNGQIDTFLFSWAPTLLLQKMLLDMYRPFSHRFENNTLFKRRMHKILDIVVAEGEGDTEKPSKKAVDTHFFREPELSMWMSITYGIELMHKHEVKRGYRYNAVVLCRPDVMLKVPLQVNEYDVDHIVFHNSGNYNTQDQFYLASSASMEKMACISSSYLSSKYYGDFATHNTDFLPFIIPHLTGKVFSNMEYTSKDPSRNYTDNKYQLFVHMPPTLRGGSVDNYRKYLLKYDGPRGHIRCSSEHDVYHQQRCSQLNLTKIELGESELDPICSSILRIPVAGANEPVFENLNLTSHDSFIKAENKLQSLRDVCQYAPTPLLDVKGRAPSNIEKRKELKSLITGLIFDDLDVVMETAYLEQK